MPINYLPQKIGDFIILSIDNDFTVSDVNQLDAAFAVLAKKNSFFVALDFSKASSVHTAIMVPLLKMCTTVAPAGGKVILVALPSDIRFFLSVVSFENQFEYLKSIDELEKMFAKAAPVVTGEQSIGVSKPVIYNLNEEETPSII